MLRLALLALVMAPASAFALGLGEIKVNSALNEPLNAEIELVSATPDELNSVSSALASRETFTRYGLDRPMLLNTLTFTATRTADGRAVLLVRSSESISEPFVTFLVEVNWARGHLLREYTVFLDPPVFTPGETQRAAAPVAAPEAGEASTLRSGTVQRPQESAPAAAPAESAATASTSAGGSTYQVRRNDTLFDISRSLRPGSLREINRTMMALYRANPEAFESNINRLRAGAILRIPDGAQIEAMSADEAAAAVAQQYSEWRSAGGGAASPHLRLVTPAEGTETGGASAGGQASPAAAAEARNLRDRISQLEGQLEEQRRLLDVKDADLARLQQQLSQQQQAAAQAATTPTPTPAESATTTPAETPIATPTPTETTPPAETQTKPTEAVTPPTPAETTPAETAPTAATQPAAGEKEGFFASITKKVQPWMLLAGAGAILVLLLVGRLIARRRRAPDLDETLGRLAAVSTASTAKFRNLREAEESKEESFLVEESGERPAAPMIAEVRPERARPEPVAKPLSDDTISSETAINLDQGDPLAEADFHMAYGLYDQAADLVRIAIERHPERRDLKLKLLEIFFVWGNKDSFLQQARELYATRAQGPSSEWDKIVIMGKQICPDDELFQQSRPAHAAAAQDVDLNLEGGENRVDVDLLAAPEDGRGAGIDLDLGGSDATAATGETPALSAEGLDFDVAATSSTREMPGPTMETPTVESAAFESPTVEQETVEMMPHDVPTVETPALEREGTIRERIDSAIVRQGQDTHVDQTAELALDDLGLDLSGLPSGDTGTVEALDEETDHPADAPTMVAGLDETSRRLLEEAAGRGRDPNRTVETSSLDEPLARDGGTGTWVLGDDTDQPVSGRGNGADSNATMRVGAAPDAGARTSTQRTLKMPAPDENLDLDLDRLSAALSGDTQRQPKPSGSAEERFSTDVFTDTSTSTGATSSRYKLDLDVGEAASDRDRAPTHTERLPAEELALPELEPVTMSEVGTKLDLARAYMDMGDPEGARSILEEVLTEGSASQKQEAQRLIASLPS
jgi:pilus assembly protein FimV